MKSVFQPIAEEPQWPVFCWRLASSGFAQHISVGIKAGVPLTGLLRSNYVSGRCCQEVPTQTKRYTIGPVVDIGLPLGFGVEFDALHKRFDQPSYTVTTTGFTTDDETGYPIQQTAGISAVGHSWEFSVAVQYHFFKSAIRPYVEGGVSLNRLSHVYSFRNALIDFRQLPFTFAPLRGSFTRVGPLFCWLIRRNGDRTTLIKIVFTASPYCFSITRRRSERRPSEFCSVISWKLSTLAAKSAPRRSGCLTWFLGYRTLDEFANGRKPGIGKVTHAGNRGLGSLEPRTTSRNEDPS